MHVFTCTTCSTAWFPSKLRCARCHCGDFTPTPVTEVVVEEVTGDPRRGAWIATVRTDPGPALIARVPPGTRPGTRLPIVGSTAAADSGEGAFAG